MTLADCNLRDGELLLVEKGKLPPKVNHHTRVWTLLDEVVWIKHSSMAIRDTWSWRFGFSHLLLRQKNNQAVSCLLWHLESRVSGSRAANCNVALTQPLFCPWLFSLMMFVLESLGTTAFHTDSRNQYYLIINSCYCSSSTFCESCFLTWTECGFIICSVQTLRLLPLLPSSDLLGSSPESSTCAQTPTELGDIIISKTSALSDLKSQVMVLPSVEQLSIPSAEHLRLRLIEDKRLTQVLKGASQTLQ